MRKLDGPSPRELEVFAAYCRADSVEQAAAELGITVSTIKNTLTHLFAKTNTVSSRQLAYRLWHK